MSKQFTEEELEEQYRDFIEQEKAKETFLASLKYEQRYIAFLDILGWKETIGASVCNHQLTEQLGTTIKWINEFVALFKYYREHGINQAGNPQVTHFSDSLLITTEYTAAGQLQLIYYLRLVVELMLELGFFIRGGVTVGQIIHRDTMVFGPGLVTAYELEKDIAIFPRIVFDERLAMNWHFDSNVYHSNEKTPNPIRYLRVDSDGVYHYDFLQPFSVGIQDYRHTQHLKFARDLIETGVKKFELNDRVKQKYNWLKNYFNNSLREHGVADIHPID